MDPPWPELTPQKKAPLMEHLFPVNGRIGFWDSWK